MFHLLDFIHIALNFISHSDIDCCVRFRMALVSLRRGVRASPVSLPLPWCFCSFVPGLATPGIAALTLGAPPTSSGQVYVLIVFTCLVGTSL